MVGNRIAHQSLSVLCERVGVAFDVGLDPHRVFERESEAGDAQYARAMESIAAHVKQGGSLANAIKAQGNYFPTHFADMIEAGEESGRLEQVLDRLAEYYHDLADMRSTFMSSIAWPMVQLVLGVLLIGLAIYVPEFISSKEEEQIDLLGFGLVGTKGLITYSMWMGGLAMVAVILYQLARRGYFQFVADWFARLPRVGGLVRIFPETRFVESLSLAVYSGVNAWTATDMAFRSANTPQFLEKAKPAKDAILQGRDMHSVLDDTGLFLDETIEAVQLGESSGRLAEVLEKHLRLLRAKVKKSMITLTNVASSVIWVSISLMLVAIIFRIFSMYLNTISSGVEDALSR